MEREDQLAIVANHLRLLDVLQFPLRKSDLL